jgi:hypothetical protein
VTFGLSGRLQYAGVAAVLLAATLAWPTPADAQGRRWRGRQPVVVTAGVYRPFYGPFFPHPFFWGFPGWHPFWGYPPFYRFGPELAAARLEVTPRDTEVYLDGHLVGVVDDFDGRFQRLRVPGGQYVLELYREGTRPWRQPVLLTPGSTLHIRHRMEPLGAGKPPPPRPVPAPDPAQDAAPTGPHTAVPDARPAPESSPRPATVDATEASALSLRVQPEDADVFIDGQPWSRVGAPDQRLVVHVSPGRHRVEIRKEGYVPYDAEVEVQPGLTRELNVSLTPRR